MHQILYLCFAMLFLSNVVANTPNVQDLPPPYNEVSLMPYYPHGWYSNHEPIAQLIDKFQVRTIVEVGSWMGLSTIDMAQMIPGDGKVYAVDTWKGSPNEDHDPQILATLYRQFLSNMIHAQVTDKVVPIRLESTEAAKIFDAVPDLVYIDATHTYEACYADLQAWYPHVRDHGVLCGDDWAWGDRGVERAVLQFASENNLKVYGNGWFWWLEE
ncbi:MAG: class I SAM-dependent methyltransferase [Simkania sp.]|nr:class I SAM-dependent methyltransferase [Simkania sp.]